MPTFTITLDKPFIVVDAVEYQEMRDRLERLEILTSTSLKRDFTAARKAFKEGKTVPFDKVMAVLLKD